MLVHPVRDFGEAWLSHLWKPEEPRALLQRKPLGLVGVVNAEKNYCSQQRSSPQIVRS